MPRSTATSSRVLQSVAWKACVDASMVRSADSWQESLPGRRHGHALRRLFDDLKIDAVLCLDGRPTVCVKDASTLTDQDVQHLRSKLWNLGATTLLVVERQRQIQVFSTFVRPATDDQSNSGLLDDETITNLESAALALRLQQLIRRVETGTIYRDHNHKASFNPKEAVDRLLLSNLCKLRNDICPTPNLAGYRRAHALIGKFLFSCYLLDRGIIGEAYLKKNGLPATKDMQQLLDSNSENRGERLDTLFNALQRDFNGSLFGDQDTNASDTEVEYFRGLLSGDLKSRQRFLFKLFDFSFIPVELISSIYQEFLAAESEADLKPATRNQPRSPGQRVQGAYYTPPRLAEMTVDIATEGWETLLDKRCLDGACGSGIFLVILFVRMAEEWRRRNPKANTRQRYEAMQLLLAENIRGVDTNLTACLVTCFSLYLAFLDQMEPKEIIELREVLERDGRSKLLPRILWAKDEEPPRSPRLRTIQQIDFFELDPAKNFHLVVGNPPWVSRKPAPSAERWLFSEKDNVAAQGLRKSERNQTLFPAKELACGFMWKASLHAKPGGRVCQVLPSRVFLSNNTDRFQAHWLKHHRLESVWLLADYSFILFPGADCPCFVGRYRRRVEGEALGEFEFVTPKVELLDPREALIPVQPEDQKTLSEHEIVEAAETEQTAIAWKKHHWGTPRDVRLVDRLMRLPKLERLVSEPPESDSIPLETTNEQRHWWKGQGFKPFNEASYKNNPDQYGEPKTRWWDDNQHYLSAKSPVYGLVLLRNETRASGKEFAKLHRQFRLPLSNPPLLLINKACTKFLFTDFSVVFQDDFQAVCAPRSQEKELLFLTAVLASPLTQYLLFHTTANIGIERDIARLEELLGLPFPLPEAMPDQVRAQAIVDDCAAILHSLKSDLPKAINLLRPDKLVAQAQRELDAKVYAYFGITKWERYLIEDTVQVFRPSSTPGTLDSEKLKTPRDSKPHERKEYADTLIETFQGWTRTKSNLWATTTLAPRTGLAMLTFGVGGRARDYKEVNAEQRVEDVINSIEEARARDGGTTIRYLRGFAYFEDTRVHLLKPLSLRHWTRTAALNDADTIIAQMMEDDGWSA